MWWQLIRIFNTQTQLIELRTTNYQLQESNAKQAAG